MGGDDLNDDYLLEPVKDDGPSKRPLDDDDSDDDETSPTPKKRKKTTNENVLIEAGCGIETSSVEDQLSFLQASLKHYSMLAGSKNDGTTAIVDSTKFGLSTKSLVNSDKETLVARIRDVVSLKRLKKHRDVRSPAVVIVCQSARRAVAVLKEVTELRLRAIKLFPKNGEIQDQLAQLGQNPFPLAVGTPHRLAALCRETKGLNFEKTQLVVLDSNTSKKQFTVCTLPDTAADTMELLREHVLPQMKTNKSLKLAFL